MSDYKNVLKMTEEQTCNFVTLYGQEAVLWDTGHALYRCKMARREAAERIATALHVKDFGVEEVVKKFKNLRSSYCQELKKIETAKKSGELYVPRVIWFSIMNSFIRPFVTGHWWKDTQSNCVSNSEAPDKKKQQLLSSEHIKIEPDDSENSLTTEIFLDDVTEEFENSDTDLLHTTDSPKKPQKRISCDSDSSLTAATLLDHVTERAPKKQTRKRMKVMSCDSGSSRADSDEQTRQPIKKESCDSDILTTLIETERAESSGVDKSKQSDISDMGDCFDLFGKYIASVLRKLPLRSACSLQQEMTQLAMDALMKSQADR